jgi:hypothetical protein
MSAASTSSSDVGNHHGHTVEALATALADYVSNHYVDMLGGAHTLPVASSCNFTFNDADECQTMFSMWGEMNGWN